MRVYIFYFIIFRKRQIDANERSHRFDHKKLLNIYNFKQLNQMNCNFALFDLRSSVRSSVVFIIFIKLIVA